MPAAPFLCNWGYFHMVSWFLALPHTAQALLATLFTWGVTALGAGLVFFFRTMNKNALDAMLGFAAGVMTAASFWSLLSPAIELAGSLGMTSGPRRFWAFSAGARCSSWATGSGSAWSAGRGAKALPAAAVR